MGIREEGWCHFPGGDPSRFLSDATVAAIRAVSAPVSVLRAALIHARPKTHEERIKVATAAYEEWLQRPQSSPSLSQSVEGGSTGTQGCIAETQAKPCGMKVQFTVILENLTQIDAGRELLLLSGSLTDEASHLYHFAWIFAQAILIQHPNAACIVFNGVNRNNGHKEAAVLPREVSAIGQELARQIRSEFQSQNEGQMDAEVEDLTSDEGRSRAGQRALNRQRLLAKIATLNENHFKKLGRPVIPLAAPIVNYVEQLNEPRLGELLESDMELSVAVENLLSHAGLLKDYAGARGASGGKD